MRSIDGQLLKRMLISAANNLYNHYPDIDALNVFPVPDGDTGMNMNLTLTSGAKEIQNKNDDDAYVIASSFSRGLLMGARGNSGVITSQIFRGFSSSLNGKKVIKVSDLVEAFLNGSKTAYKAVMRPVEGTILTVVRESSDALSHAVKADSSIEKAIDILLSEAKRSLDRTPDLLPILKEVGVVDSGGAGFVSIIEGMRSALNGKFIEKMLATSIDKEGSQTGENKGDKVGYVVSFTMKLGPSESKKPFVEKKFRSMLSSRGSDVNVAREENVVKVSMKTMAPGSIISYAQSFGEFSNLSINNESEEQKTPEEKVEISKEEVVSKPRQDFAIVAISAGKGLNEIYSQMGVDRVVFGGQTMNPSIEDISSAIRECNAKNVFVLPNNSNIIMAALQAADLLSEECNVLVVPTKTTPQGLVVASVFNPDISASENYEEMKKAIKNVKSGSVTYAIKDTVIDGVEVTKDYFMGIFDKKIVTSKKVAEDALFALIDEMVDEDSSILTLIIGESVDETTEQKVAKKIESKYSSLDIDIERGDQPVYSYLVGIE